MSGEISKSSMSESLAPLTVGFERRNSPHRNQMMRTRSSYRRKSSRRRSTIHQRRATFAAIPGADVPGFNNSNLVENYRSLGNQLGLHPHQNYDNVLSPIGMAPDAPVSRSRSVNHLAPIFIPGNEADKCRKSMQHFGSNISLASGAFPQPWQPSAGERPMYDGPDLPSTDLPEDHSVAEPQPLPLDISKLHTVQGYEHVTCHSHSSSTPVPPPLEAIMEVEKPEEKFASIAKISEAEARDALLDYVADKCCYGKAAANDLQITNITPSCAYHYTLETYSESRYTSWEHEPYRGQFLEGSSAGEAPQPWELHCNPTQMFHDEIHHLEVPFSSNIIPCHGCNGLGWLRCHVCLGRGFLRCLTCSGSGRTWHTDARGHKHTECCWHCHGTGRKTCFTCGGDGRIQCKTCQGYRQLKCYIKLTVNFKNQVHERVIEHSDLPSHLIKDVEGDVIFEQTQNKVWGLANHSDPELCILSQRLVTEEQSRCQKTSRIVMQRQQLQAVPVVECAYVWKEEEDGRYWVYGKEGEVYAPDYPQKYCWGCIIL